MRNKATRWTDRRLKAQAAHRLVIIDKYEPTPEAQEELLRALRAPRDLTAIVCGDPLPGRSALDREKMR